ncbi:MAG: hypothetical protein HYT22_03645 [Candidatus Niyogibacteria bacterium]|nr:hypothetical protein [Candidatus Niyogibacteria bacterium]
MINKAFERRRETHAYQRLVNPIPLEDLYPLAVWASEIMGGGIDPLILVGIHQIETIRLTGVGECAFIPDKHGQVPLVLGANLNIPDGFNDDEETQKLVKWQKRVKSRFERESKAFLVIFRSINEKIRHPRYRLQGHYLLASCGAGALGPMQFMPTVWNSYEREVCRELCAVLHAEYVSPYHLVPAIFGAAALLKDNSRSMGHEPSDVRLGAEEEFKLVSAAYYAGSKYAESYTKEYGKPVYKRAMMASERIILFSPE